MVWYVVHVGRQTGVFSSWGLAHAQVDGYRGGCCKKYRTKEEADAAYYGLLEEQEVQPADGVPEEEEDDEMQPAVPVPEANKSACSVKNVIILVLALIIVLLLFKLL
jgi:viroplasmin and RNaseH domain-containing protein